MNDVLQIPHQMVIGSVGLVRFFHCLLLGERKLHDKARSGVGGYYVAAVLEEVFKISTMNKVVDQRVVLPSRGSIVGNFDLPLIPRTWQNSSTIRG